MIKVAFFQIWIASEQWRDFSLSAQPYELAEAKRARVLAAGFPFVGGDGLVDPDISVLSITRWHQRALLRYFELWGDITADKFLRGLAGKPGPLRQSFAGMIGSLNAKGMIERTRRSGEWQARDMDDWYPKIRRLPQDGIKRARELAWQLAQQKKGGTSRPTTVGLPRQKRAVKQYPYRYKGHPFRNQVEAEWAAFFDALEIVWLYEPKEFDLAGTPYTPTFYLPRLDYWIGVHPEMAQWPDNPLLNYPTDGSDMSKLPEGKCYVLAGRPQLDPKEVYQSEYVGHTCYGAFSNAFGYIGYALWDEGYYWCECPICHQVGLHFEGRSGRLCDCIDSDKVYNVATPRLVNAYDFASSNRDSPPS